MWAPLWLKKAHTKLIADSRGFSSIVGAVFAVLVIISLTSTVFVWSLSQNTLYNNTVRQNNQADLDRSSEKIIANITCNRVNGNTVSVNGTLENSGPLSTQIVTLWVADATQSTSAFNSSLPITLKPGDVTTLSGSTAINVNLANSPGDSLSCWFISGRGNKISKNPLFALNTGNSNTWNTYANVSQGIGLIGFDFKGFSHCDFSSKPSGNNIPLGPFVKTYVISQYNYTVFHVVLTNYDPGNQTMTLNATSAVYLIGSHQSTVKYALWNVVNVTGDAVNGYKLNPGFAALYKLPIFTPVEVFFAGTVGSPAIDPQVYPLNIMVFGKLGSDDYGQNVPFVALNVQ